MAILVVIVGTTVITGGQTADAPSQLAIVLHLYDYVHMAPKILQHAREETARVYAGIGVSVEWVDDRTDFVPGDPRPNFAVAIVADPGRTRSTLSDDAMGSAPGTIETRGRIAYAFHDRIAAASHSEPFFFGRMLGLVIAHETGHLLLPYGSHSETGIMRGVWNMKKVPFAPAEELTFTDEQAELIRNHFAVANRAIATDADRK